MDDLKITYGLFNLRKEREFARSSFEYVKNDIADIKNNYIRLGFHLAEIRDMKYYEDFGYDNFNEFCEVNFGLEKSMVSRCISVWSSFCENGEATFGRVGSGSKKMWIDKKYSAYNYSQLCEMVSMDDTQRLKVTPNMTVKQIREIKKGKVDIVDSSSSGSSSSSGCDVATNEFDSLDFMIEVCEFLEKILSKKKIDFCNVSISAKTLYFSYLDVATQKWKDCKLTLFMPKE